MTTYIPKNARKILANSTLTREYFLKPYGLDVSRDLNRHLKMRISLKNIHSTNSSSIVSSSGVLVSKSMITPSLLRLKKDYPSQSWNSTSKNYTTWTLRRLTLSDTWEKSRRTQWAPQWSQETLRKPMSWPITKSIPFSMEWSASDSYIKSTIKSIQQSFTIYCFFFRLNLQISFDLLVWTCLCFLLAQVTLIDRVLSLLDKF